MQYFTIFFLNLNVIFFICSKESLFNNDPPVTLSDPSHYIEYTAADIAAGSLEFRLEFRTYDEDRLLLWNKYGSTFDLIVYINSVGFVEFEMTTSTTKYKTREAAKNGWFRYLMLTV